MDRRAREVEELYQELGCMADPLCGGADGSGVTGGSIGQVEVAGTRGGRV